MFLRKDLTGHMDYVSENYSKHLLIIHLVFVVKYRRNLLGKKRLSGQIDIYHVALEMFLRKQLKNIYKIKVRAYIRYLKRIAVLRLDL